MVKRERSLDQLTSVGGPATIQLPRPDEALLSAVADAGMTIIRVDGSKLRTKAEVFEQFGIAFKFPSRVEVWDAFSDWMRDLTWLDEFSGIVLVIENAALILMGKPKERETFFAVLGHINAEWCQPIAQGEWWDRPAKPFHVLLIG